MSLKLNPKTVVNALAKEFAPDFVTDLLEKEAKDKTVAQFYRYIEQGIWNSLAPGQRQFIINQKPWDLDWLTVDFIVEAVARSNQTVACLIITSPDLQSKIQKQIQEIQEMLA